MEFKAMAVTDVSGVAGLYCELAYVIKEATQDTYFDFDELSLAEMEKWVMASFEKPERVTFLAKEDQQIIGFISGETRDCFFPFSKTKRVGYIAGAFVLPVFRHQGVMRSLESMMLGYFRRQNLAYIELNVMTENTIGKQCWESLGYKTFHEHMRKKL